MAPYLAEHNILEIASHGIAWELTEYGNWICYEGPTPTNFAILGDFAYDLGYRTMTVLGHDYSAGYEMMGGVAHRFEEKGGTVTLEQWAPFGTSDYTPYLNKIEESGADVFAFAIWMPDILTLINQYYEFGIKTPWLTRVDELVYPDNLAKFGEFMVGTRGLATYPPTVDLPSARQFNEAFQSRFGREPYDGEFRGYVLMSIYLAGLEATGGDARLEVLRPAILGLEVETPKGPVNFSTNGMSIVDQYMVELKEIEGEYVWDVFDIYHQSSLYWEDSP